MDAGLTAAQISDVVLVGGSTRIPLVKRAVTTLFGKKPYDSLDPDLVVALGAANDGKVSLLVVVTKDLVGRLKAGELIKEMATEVGGTGGGRPEMAQAGGKNPEGLSTALEKVFGLVQKALEG